MLAKYSFAKLEQDIQIEHLDIEMAAVGAGILGARTYLHSASHTHVETRSPAPVS